VLRKGFDTAVVPVQESLKSSDRLRSQTRSTLSDHFDVPASGLPPVKCVNHHLTHAASAFHPSGFDKALIVTMDEHGDSLSTGVYIGSDRRIDMVDSMHRFNSLGRLYGDITEFLGFRRSNGEGKVMGLAPYGEENEEVKATLDNWCSYENGSYDVEELTYRPRSDSTRKVQSGFPISPRYWKDEIAQVHKDIARHTQVELEEIVTSLVSHYLDEYGLTRVCLAGGVALNCKMNKRVRELDAVEEMFVQPIANDAGGSLGACHHLSSRAGDEIDEQYHPYYGPSFSNAEIESTLEELKLPYQKPDDVVEATAENIVDGELIGWFQGRMEAGPRALGNRSILADPREMSSLDRVNRYVKHREEWRPFAPSMLPSETERFLVGEPSKAARFMIDTYDSTEAAKSEIPAVLHPEDATTRPQVVNESANPRYNRLLTLLREKTGVGVVLNTSFNDSGEPIVRRPREAIRDFFSSGLDKLVLGDYVLEKSQLSEKSANA